MSSIFNVGDNVEILFDYFNTYLPEDHEHLERKYFSTITDIQLYQKNVYLYSLKDFKLVFYSEDLKLV